jgi:hypothetical protein
MIVKNLVLPILAGIQIWPLRGWREKPQIDGCTAWCLCAFDLVGKCCVAALYCVSYENKRFVIHSIPLAVVYLLGWKPDRLALGAAGVGIANMRAEAVSRPRLLARGKDRGQERVDGSNAAMLVI